MKHKTLYKFLRNGLKSDNGENRDWKIGEWRKEESIEICSTGFHASQNPAHALSYVQGEIIAIVEVKGESVSEKDKECWSEMRIKKAWNWKKEDMIAFAIYAAEQVIGIYEKQYPNDDRPRKAIEASKQYMKNQTKENKDAAYAASYAADAAADSAYAAYAASYAADAAAYAAAYAAYAASYAADAAYAAYAASYAADAAADAAYAASYAAAYAARAADRAALWGKLGEWMENRIASLEEYK